MKKHQLCNCHMPPSAVQIKRCKGSSEGSCNDSLSISPLALTTERLIDCHTRAMKVNIALRLRTVSNYRSSARTWTLPGAWDIEPCHSARNHGEYLDNLRFCIAASVLYKLHRMMAGAPLWLTWWWQQHQGNRFSTSTFLCAICKYLWLDFLHPCTLAHKTAESQRGDPVWQASPYLAIGQDNGCCHRSWQAAKCNFCSILHSGSTLHPRSSAAAPSSQSHPFANFFSPKTGRPGRMTVPTIRSDTVSFTGGGRGGGFHRRAEHRVWLSATIHVNPPHVNTSRWYFHV